MARQDGGKWRQAPASGAAEPTGAATSPTPIRQRSDDADVSSNPPHNLPADLSSFVGREAEIAELAEILAGHRLVTLSGSPGGGKTRLATKVAGVILPRFHDGAWLVDLAAVAEPNLVPQAIASTLQIPLSDARSAADTVVEALRGQRLLLILDNCEHLLTACAGLAARLLAASPGLTILATSRQPLRVDGEVDWRVPPLTIPDPAEPIDPVALLSYDAVRLFVERGQTSRLTFGLSTENAAAVAQICVELDGLPLALELAAVWLNMLTPRQIVERLAGRFSLLTRGRQSGTERHRTLRGLIDWSHDLLTEPEQVLFRRLAVFAGGWTLDAAEAIMADGPAGEDGAPGSAADTLHGLAELIDASLVVVDPRHQGRYRMLETLREYALEKLRASGEEQRLRLRHQRWVLALAESGSPMLIGAYDPTWPARIGAEIDNVRAALAWGRDHPADSGDGAGPAPLWAALRLATACYFIWFWRGQLGEGADWLGQLLTLAEASTERETPANEQSCMRGAVTLALITFLGGDIERAAPLVEDGATRAAALGDPLAEGYAVMIQGSLTAIAGDLDRAAVLMDRGLTMVQTAGASDLAMSCQFYRAELTLMRGDADLAEARFSEVVAYAQGVGLAWGIAEGLGGLARTAAARGDHASAVRLHQEGLPVRVEVGDWIGQTYTIEGLARALVALGAAGRAVLLLGAVAARRARLGIAQPAALGVVGQGDAAIAASRMTLGPAAFDEAFERGRQLRWGEAIELALQADLEAPRPGPESAPARPLTRREREIATMIGRGYTNRQIADAAVISERTAEWYIAQIRTKLGLETRVQVGVWAAQHGLVSDSTGS